MVLKSECKRRAATVCKLMVSWYLRGYLREGYEWLRKMLTLNYRDESLARANLLSGAGWLANVLSDLKAAKDFSEESVALFRKLGDEINVAFPLAVLGEQPDYDYATQSINESLNLFKRVGNKWGV